MADVQQILSDPAFHSLPLGERLKVMRTVDPNFAALPPRDQGTVLYQSAIKVNPPGDGSEGPPDEGFFSTLGSDIFHLPLNLLKLANPVTTSQDIAHNMHDLGEKAIDAFKRGDVSSGLGYGTAAAVPIIGPAAAQAGEEWNRGQSGQAAAHTLELLAPFMREGVLPVARGVEGAYRGGVEGFKSAPASPWLALAGEQLGQHFGHPVAGTIAGSVLPKTLPTLGGMIRGGIRGVMEGPPPDPFLRYPGEISGSPTGGRFDPAQYGAGSTPVIPPVETGGGHVPDYTGPQIQPIPPVGPSDISGNPTVGRFDVNEYSAPPVRPSSVPGYQSVRPIHPATVDISSGLESSPAPQAAAPAPIQPIQPVTGLHLPEVPPHYAGEPNPTAAFKNDQAIVAELRKVPGITQDSLTPDMVHEVRKALGQRALKPADVERRVDHIRMLLPK